MPIELKHPKKGLINIKNNDQKCFLWCHVRHINPSKEHPGIIKEIDKRIASILNYDGIEFPVKKKILKRLKYKIIFLLMYLAMRMGWFFQVIFLIKNLKTLWICCF